MNQFPRHMPDWSWWKPWEWPGHILHCLKSWEEYREAAHHARRAKVEAETAEAAKPGALFEIQVAGMLRKFRKHYNEAEVPPLAGF